MKKKAVYGFPVLLGIIFCLYYLYRAADNVVYSDYIRLINAYLPDVGNPDKFFVPDILTRVPVTFLGRIINVKFFGYNTMFDMILGVLSLGVGAAALSLFARRIKGNTLSWLVLVLALYFGLDKWEMLTNGTGWVCFLSISGFYWHYLILDHAIRTGHGRKEQILLMVLPSVLTLFVAGPYCGSYSALLTLVYLVMLALDYRQHKKINRLYLSYLAAVLVPLFLYLWSNSTAVYVHRGAVEGSVFKAFFADPMFFVRFLLNSFASAGLGVNQLTAIGQSSHLVVYLIGLFVIGLYLYALFLTWKHRLYAKTIFPLLLILNGGLNHLLILSARWIFLKDSYGMSSRYAIQFQMGMIGIVWTFALVSHLKRGAKKTSMLTEGFAVCACTAVLLTGSLYTTFDEMRTAPYRKAYLETSRGVALNYENATDEELETYLHHDPDEIRAAMRILEENHLNLFK